jgi:MinD superfamily P-loop ATPase
MLNAKELSSFNYYGSKKAAININLCSECGLCEDVCSFNAIKNLEVDQIACEGCGFCYRVCPSGAIDYKTSKSGTYYKCRLADNSSFFYAKLLPGEGNTGKLISEIKKSAGSFSETDIGWVIVDGPPGIGCPVNASITGSDFAVIVTEPTISGLKDLERLTILLRAFAIKSGIIVNKCDLNEEIAADIAWFADKKNIPLLGYIPFDRNFVKAVIQGRGISGINEVAGEIFRNIWDELNKQILDKKKECDL